MYDKRKQLKRTMHLLEPVLCASFLNDKGDIIAALDKNLVVIHANSYQFLTADEMATLVSEHAKNQQQALQPGQPLSQAAMIAQRAAMQLLRSGSKVHQALVRQLTIAQVIDKIMLQLCCLSMCTACVAYSIYTPGESTCCASAYSKKWGLHTCYPFIVKKVYLQLISSLAQRHHSGMSRSL